MGMETPAEAAVVPTIKAYLDDTYLFHSTGAKVVQVVKDETQGMAIITDQTIFHPQGGGQPTDQGVSVLLFVCHRHDDGGDASW